jgi:hypothetical protein
MTIRSKNPELRPSPETVAKPVQTSFRIFEKLTLNQQIERQNFLEKWAEIDMSQV